MQNGKKNNVFACPPFRFYNRHNFYPIPRQHRLIYACTNLHITSNIHEYVKKKNCKKKTQKNNNNIDMVILYIFATCNPKNTTTTTKTPKFTFINIFREPNYQWTQHTPDDGPRSWYNTCGFCFVDNVEEC